MFDSDATSIGDENFKRLAANPATLAGLPFSESKAITIATYISTKFSADCGNVNP